MRCGLRPLGAALALVVAAPLLGGCTEGGAAGRTPVAVYAASSLTEAFGELEVLFEEQHPGADVRLTFAGSQVLRVQIEQGAPADVFASADPEHLAALVRAGLVSEGRGFAENELVLIVPLDNPAGIESFEDLPDARRIVLGTPQVPVGRYAREALAKSDTLLRPGFRAAVLERVVSEESNARLTRSKVELGEADAAIVYRTDASTTERVRQVPIPDEVNVRAQYLIGIVQREGRSLLADAWVELLDSAEGRAVLRRRGFSVR